MEPTPLVEIAQVVAGFGVLGMVVAMLNVVALRVVHDDDVPACVQGRIRWWSAHNAAFLIASAGVAAAGLALLAAAVS